FVGATVGLAADIVRSVGISLVQLLSNIITRMDNAYAGVALAAPNISNEKVVALKKMLDMASDNCDREAGNIEEVYRDIEKCIARYQLFALNPNLKSKEDLYGCIDVMKTRLMKCVKLSEVMEDIGATI